MDSVTLNAGNDAIYGVTENTTTETVGTSGTTGVALIFIVIFFVLFLIFLFILTYYLDVRNKLIGCQSDQNIWCYNDWTCKNSITCPADTNICFTNGGTIGPNGKEVSPPGLVNCLIGPDSTAATFCLQTTPCDCTMDNANNCFQGCAISAPGSFVPPNAACCATTNNCN